MSEQTPLCNQKQRGSINRFSDTDLLHRGPSDVNLVLQNLKALLHYVQYMSTWYTLQYVVMK